jgi:hypothetical protein
MHHENLPQRRYYRGVGAMAATDCYNAAPGQISLRPIMPAMLSA